MSQHYAHALMNEILVLMMQFHVILRELYIK